MGSYTRIGRQMAKHLTPALLQRQHCVHSVYQEEVTDPRKILNALHMPQGSRKIPANTVRCLAGYPTYHFPPSSPKPLRKLDAKLYSQHLKKVDILRGLLHVKNNVSVLSENSPQHRIIFSALSRDFLRAKSASVNLKMFLPRGP